MGLKREKRAKISSLPRKKITDNEFVYTGCFSSYFESIQSTTLSLRMPL